MLAHSAGGATDVLLAAVLCPELFRRMVVIEPTISEPSAGGESEPEGWAFGRGLLEAEAAGRRKSRFIDH